MKYLIILNKKFPFQTGESFLENEMKEIPQDFDRILLFPIHAVRGEEPTRKITRKNVTFFSVNQREFQYRKIKIGLKAGFKTPFSKIKQRTWSQKFDQLVDDLIVQEVTPKIISQLAAFSIKSEDEIVIYSYWLHTTASIAVKLKEYFSREGCKNLAISRAHGFDIYQERKKNQFLPSREYLMENLDFVLPISENGATYLKQRFTNQQQKIFVSKLGTYHQGLNVPSTDQRFRILTVSRMIPLKRLELLIDALSRWQVTNVSWTHIGDGPERKKIEARAQEKLAQIDFECLGYRANQEVYQYYQNNPVDVFINISSTEGIPVSIMEAISFGVPVVATDVGGTSEVVINQENGYLIPSNFSSDILLQCLERIKNQSVTDQQRLRTAAKLFWQKNYQAQTNYHHFYQKIAKELADA
ncbi:glycosyltransferase [Candidatus Enterococcus courvalinii]|uniref:Glycosyltransferase n=1 Tax=Candidatus Enterococcus courvalinii TaxID=2815329 RepID=A0ABS3HX13_9ENTE|nr:glycosyltransferase [Enterococcus sp. MSG2901]MBO0481012.1 glycosyltransferase [Enterococcus sp. MSG2901]